MSCGLATKQRREAIALARQYGREDIAQQEEQELAILEAYLPEQLSTDDLIQRIDAVIQELGATSDKDLGRVMRVLMPSGARASGWHYRESSSSASVSLAPFPV